MVKWLILKITFLQSDPEDVPLFTHAMIFSNFYIFPSSFYIFCKFEKRDLRKFSLPLKNIKSGTLKQSANMKFDMMYFSTIYS